MEKKDLELELLLEQRKTLISDIKELNSNMFKVVIAIIPLVLTIIVSYFFKINEKNAPAIRYGMLEIILILSMVISACLFAANNNRDYIAAIDKYIFKKYNISVLFHHGELSRKHTTGIKGIFPLTTLLIGASSLVIILFSLKYMYDQDNSFYKSNIYLGLFLVAQIVVYLIIIIINFIRKLTKKSKITKQCLKYIKRSEKLEQQDKISTLEKIKLCPFYDIDNDGSQQERTGQYS